MLNTTISEWGSVDLRFLPIKREKWSTLLYQNSAAEGLPSAALPVSDGKRCQSLLKRSHAFVRKPETGKAASMMQTIYRICCVVKTTFPQPV